MFKFEGTVTNITDKKPGASCLGCTATFTAQCGAGVHPPQQGKSTQKAPTPLENRQEMCAPFTPASASPHGWRSYCFGFSDVGFSSALLLVAALGFEAAAAMTVFGCQKSAATVTTASGGLLSSGENRNRTDSLCSTDSAFTCRNFL